MSMRLVPARIAVPEAAAVAVDAAAAVVTAVTDAAGNLLIKDRDF